LIDRDAHILFIKDTIDNFNIDDISNLVDQNPKTYSPPAIWAIFEDIPKFLEENKLFNPEKQELIKEENIPMHLYELYVSQRIKNDDEPLEHDDKKEIKRVFLQLLHLLKNTNLIRAEEKIEKDENL